MQPTSRDPRLSFLPLLPAAPLAQRRQSSAAIPLRLMATDDLKYFTFESCEEISR